MPVPDGHPDDPLDPEDEEPDDELDEEDDEDEEFELELAELPSMKLWGTERNFSLKKPEYPGSASVRNGSAA